MPKPSTRSGHSTASAANEASIETQNTDLIAFPIVGIGASAGGLASFIAFFDGMPADKDAGMAFVLVQHLAPDHESILAELVQRSTHMRVFEVKDDMQVEINCVYIIPPNRDMGFLNGTLQLLEPTTTRGLRLPIDYLFRSLAQDQGARAIGVVLSGTGCDGTMGLRAIKGEGGMVIAQTLDSCAFDGMPRSAIATGLVDFTLAPRDMPAQLISYAERVFGKPMRRVSGVSVQNADHNSLVWQGKQEVLKKIFILLRTQTGHDFSQYKPSTICRRIERRMAVHQILNSDDYLKYLQHAPTEIDALFRDLLIGVTCFFRDPESFAALEQQVIPKLFNNKPPGAAIRVWCSGCSTGEEGYSIAILLLEQMEKLQQNFQLQVFATDIDSRGIAFARAGIFPASVAADIGPERLARFFTAAQDGASYRVNKVIRDMLIFSDHNLIKNPPFSKLDLITCRNVLIYLDSEIQKKVIAVFHYALNQGGVLFLGSSETAGDSGDLFIGLDRKAKLYQRTEDFPSASGATLARILPNAASADLTGKYGSTKTLVKRAQNEKPSLRELTEQAILQQLAPVGALVNGSGDILYLHGRTGMFLEPSPGEAGINNILRMAREGLRIELTSCLRKAAANKECVRVHNLRVKTNGHFSLVDLSVCPLPSETTSVRPANLGASAADARLESPLFLVILAEVKRSDSKPVRAGKMINSNHASEPQSGEYATSEIAELHAELQAKDEYLHAVNEQLNTSNEELKSSNEEMQSINEEMQSSNEELETSKEELQSMNEELNTVNTELQSKVNDLSRVNNDMNNLLAGTGIGTVFVDYALRILRFTPAATQLINLIQSDVGRPVGHIMSNMLGYDSLVSDIQAVLKTLIPKEIDVQIKPPEARTAEAPAPQAKFYTLRILPYRTLENVIEGAVITFTDITEIVRAREALRAANDLLRLAVVVRDAFDAIMVQDLEGRITAWNPGAERMYGWTEAEALTMNNRDRIPEALREKAVERMHQLSQARVLAPCVTHRIAKDNAILEISLTSTALVDSAGKMYAIASTERATEAPANHSPRQLLS